MKGFSRLMEDRIYFFFLEFAGKVELDMLKIHLSHLENIITVGKEDIPSITVFCQDRKSTRLNSSHRSQSRMPSSA